MSAIFGISLAQERALPPLRGFSSLPRVNPRLAPWAAILRRFAARSTIPWAGFFPPLRGCRHFRGYAHGLRRGLQSCAASRLIRQFRGRDSSAPPGLPSFPRVRPRLAPWAAILRRSAARSTIPGGILPPLRCCRHFRGCTHGLRRGLQSCAAPRLVRQFLGR